MLPMTVSMAAAVEEPRSAADTNMSRLKKRAAAGTTGIPGNCSRGVMVIISVIRTYITMWMMIMKIIIIHL